MIAEFPLALGIPVSRLSPVGLPLVVVAEFGGLVHSPFFDSQSLLISGRGTRNVNR